MTAPDGSPIGFYELLPAAGEPELIHAALPSGAAVLELGAGAGRITTGLVALGHPVTAVDQSPAMLQNIRVAETIAADIETLNLGRTFGGVVLASHLVNTPDDSLRHAFLLSCRRHVAPRGLVIIERHDPRWASSALETTVEGNGVRSTIRNIRHNGPIFSAVMEYMVGGRSWVHPFSARILSDADTVSVLADADLVFERWLDRDRRWLAAAPAGASDATLTAAAREP